MISLNVNGKEYKADVAEEASLLWVLRDHLKLTGTKFGCGIGECGSCTVHVDGKAERSCGMTVGEVKGKKITTIEGFPRTILSNGHGSKNRSCSAVTASPGSSCRLPPWCRRNRRSARIKSSAKWMM